MARTLDQIIAELGGTYNPQIESLRRRQELIPGQVAEEEKGLQARQETAFGDIVSGARRRGLGFSGIPLSEQAKYTSTEFLPALARLRQQGREQAMSLEDAILGITERRSTLAQQLREQELNREEQQRQFNENLRFQREQEARQAAATGFSPSFGGGSGGGPAPSGGGGASMQQRGDKGFTFTISGQPVSAAVYAHATGQSFRSVLQKMANAGDRGAATALGFVGEDYGYDPRKVTSKGLADLYNALVWGTGRTAKANLPPGYGTGAYLRQPQGTPATNRLLTGIPGIR